MKRIILDTNAYIAYLRGDTNVLDILSCAQTVYCSSVVIGELHAGFKGGNREAENRKILDRFLNKSTVRTLSVTPDTADFFATIKDGLHRKRSPIPMNDVWIAAHAMESGSMLVTYDAHFLLIDGILVWDQLRAARKQQYL